MFSLRNKSKALVIFREKKEDNIEIMWFTLMDEVHAIMKPAMVLITICIQNNTIYFMYIIGYNFYPNV
ncbi:MAG TPA: hypothetical protein VEW92_04330 [Nitrososphaeraceae archaeon]|nr:hypothetical protein [Nitrososphaeraceae archaeon]